MRSRDTHLPKEVAAAFGGLALSVLLSHIPVSEKSVAAIKLDVLTGKG